MDFLRRYLRPLFSGPISVAKRASMASTDSYSVPRSAAGVTADLESPVVQSTMGWMWRSAGRVCGSGAALVNAMLWVDAAASMWLSREQAAGSLAAVDVAGCEVSQGG